MLSLIPNTCALWKFKATVVESIIYNLKYIADTQMKPAMRFKVEIVL